ncbi:MAG: DUF167 family protein [Hyphomicrobiaceae bacterium]|nr:DUF167 family protein [Hyphomicrobiaceae bacterium]
MRTLCHQQNSNGLLVFFRLTPNARKDEILGVVETPDGPVIAAKVRAIPDKGKANKALMALAGKGLGIAKSLITLKSGSKSRLKTLLIEGNASELAAELDKALAEALAARDKQK